MERRLAVSTRSVTAEELWAMAEVPGKHLELVDGMSAL
jgi:hypothetical protein